MTTAELLRERPGHHPLQSAMVMTLVGGVALGVGYSVSGGYENIRHRIQTAYDTSLGMKDIDIKGDTGSKTIAIGVAASSCVKNDAFSVDRVYKTHDSPNEFTVVVQKVGAGTLNAANIEACIAKETHENVVLTVSGGTKH